MASDPEMISLGHNDFPGALHLADVTGRITEAQCDFNSHLNMAEYVRIFDSLASVALDELGVGQSYVARTRRSLFVSKMAVKYIAELRAGDCYAAAARLLAFDTRRVLTEFWLRRDSGEAAATACCEWAHVDLETRRPLDLLATSLGQLQSVARLQVERVPRITL
jgi:acyl-CoA thioester hydrolase